MPTRQTDDCVASPTADAVAALRAVRHGGVDDATLGMRLPPTVQASVSPTIAAGRWAAVLYGMVYAVPAAEAGDLRTVYALSFLLFLTSWRSLRPIRLAGARPLDRSLHVTDAVLAGAALGWSTGTSSPFVFAALVIVGVATFALGIVGGLRAAAAAGAGFVSAAILTDAPSLPSSSGVFGALIAVVVVLGFTSFARHRLVVVALRQRGLEHTIEVLGEANDLLHVLSRVARTLPNALDHRDALHAVRDQIVQAFRPDTVCLVTPDGPEGRWVSQLAVGCRLAPALADDDLPGPLARLLRSESPFVADLPRGGLSSTSRSGLYTELRWHDDRVGLLAIESRDPGRFDDREVRLLDGLADVIALTLDNSRTFGQLRRRSEEAERSRIARDLHDRLGQWLTFISLELERIISGVGGDEELERLRESVGIAIDELRESLRQLRATVDGDHSFEQLARGLLDRFGQRSDVRATIRVAEPGRRADVGVENEFLRVLQEALHNVEKHAAASNVSVLWRVDDAGALLEIVDDGRGFEPDESVRDSAYGLIGMHERASAVGAQLDIQSQVGRGTRVRVAVSHRGATS